MMSKRRLKHKKIIKDAFVKYLIIISREEYDLSSVDDDKKGKKKQRKRHENSLGELTRSFIKHIHQSKDKIIEISEVVKQLQVKKRRIYDITNVLEGISIEIYSLGIGHIEKIEKNKLKWVGGDYYSEKSDEEEDESEISEQQAEENTEQNANEAKLDEWISEMKQNIENLTNSEEFKQFGYLTYNDLKSLSSSDKTSFIAIRAPQGSSLEIPDPNYTLHQYNEKHNNMVRGLEEWDEELLKGLENKYQIYIDSPNEEIKVFLVLAENVDNNFIGNNPFNYGTKDSSKSGRNDFISKNNLMNKFLN